MISYQEDWAMFHRSGAMMRGSHTNNYCESAMSILKDVILNR